MAQRIVTLLFTDIEGSTKLWEAHADGMRKALPRHDALIKKAVEDNAGIVFKTVGDGFFCAFPVPDSAVSAALQLQMAIHGTTWQVPDLRVRCAIHTGTVEARGGDYFGLALSRAARMLQASFGGQTLVSEASKALIDSKLPEGATLYDHGPQRLRDLERAEHLFELRHPGSPVDLQGLRSTNEFPSNLPEQVTSFIGREELIERVTDSLEAARLVTLTGSGGAGKTRLALQTAHSLIGEFADGVWFIDLSTVTDPSLVGKAVANSLNLREQAGSSMQDNLAEFAERRSMLLILDNCEHVVDACSLLVDALLKSSPKLRVLCTSREALGIAGEVNFKVPSLQVPAIDADEGSILASESVRLFVERARQADSGFNLRPEAAKSIARIVTRLDGIPLAIELAAARASSMSIEALSARLDESFRILTGGSKAAMERQQTVRAMIDWSYNLLTDPERAMLRRLGVFSGGWTLEAAESVCADGEQIVSEDVLDLLVHLVNKSLVLYDEFAARYRLLETVRWYARQKIAESDEGPETRNRHLESFLAIAESAELTGANQVEALDRLEMEHKNLLAALDWCEASPLGSEPCLRMVAALGRFWYMHGHFATGRKALASALDRAEAQPGTAVRGEALISAALLARVQGDLGAAERYLQEARAVFQGLDDKRGLSTTLNALGNVMREGGRYEEARKIWDEALALRVEIKDRAGIAVVRGNLGIVAMLNGRYEEAEQHIQSSLAEERAMQRRSHEGIALSNLGLLKMWQGDLESARNYSLLALEVNREVGTKLVESRDLHHLGQVEVALGNIDAARTYLVGSLRISSALAAKELIADAVETTATMMNRLTRCEVAVILAGAAERIRHEAGCAMAPNEVGKYEAELAEMSDVLGGDFARLLEEGRSMRSGDAVDLAISSLLE